MSEQDVFGDGQAGNDGKLLVHGGDAVYLGVVGIGERPAECTHGERAAVRAQHTGDDLDERRLAGPVLAEQGVYLARGDT